MGEIGTFVAADLLQVAVVVVCLSLFLFVRAACGPRARFITHLGLGYLGVAVFYIFDIGARVFEVVASQPLELSMVEVIGSTISLVNTAFFITAWGLMRDTRIEIEAGVVDTLVPSMSKPFAAKVIVGLIGGIAAYITLAHLLASSSALRRLFLSVDATISMVVLILLAVEVAQMPLLRDADEGSLFPSGMWHLIFRLFTASLFVLWGFSQWGRVLSGWFDWGVLEPFAGQWYQWSAVFKVLCGGLVAILAIHALPSVRWPHRRIP